MKQSALGMIETYGYIGALAGADAAVKAAMVQIDGLEMVKGGIVTVMITGDVGAVRAAVEAGEQEARRVGNFRRSHVIARISTDVEAMLSKAETVGVEAEVKAEVVPAETTEASETQALEKICEALEAPEPQAPEEICEAPESPETTKPAPTTVKIRTREELMGLKVVKLRNIARSLEHINIDRNRIKFSNKEELINGILASYERG